MVYEVTDAPFREPALPGDSAQVGGLKGLFAAGVLVGPFARPVAQRAVGPAEGRQETGAETVVEISVQLAQGYVETLGGLGPVTADDSATLGLVGPREPDVAVESATGALQRRAAASSRASRGRR